MENSTHQESQGNHAISSVSEATSNAAPASQSTQPATPIKNVSADPAQQARQPNGHTAEVVVVDDDDSAEVIQHQMAAASSAKAQHPEADHQHLSLEPSAESRRTGPENVMDVDEQDGSLTKTHRTWQAKSTPVSSEVNGVEESLPPAEAQHDISKDQLGGFHDPNAEEGEITYPTEGLQPVDFQDEGEDGTELFVGGIKPTVTDAELRELFSKAGEIVDLYVKLDKRTQTRKPYAFIRFKTKEAAEKALALKGTELHGRPLNVNSSGNNNRRLMLTNVDDAWNLEGLKAQLKQLTDTHKSIIDIELKTEGARAPANNIGIGALLFDSSQATREFMRAMDGRLTLSSRTLRLDWPNAIEGSKPVDTSSERTLYVSNLPPDMKKEELEERFGKYGKVARIWLSFLDPSQYSKRNDYAFVTLETDEAIKAAITAEQGAEVREKHLDISMAKPRRTREEFRRGYVAEDRGSRFYERSGRGSAGFGSPPRRRMREYEMPPFYEARKRRERSRDRYEAEEMMGPLKRMRRFEDRPLSGRERRPRSRSPPFRDDRFRPDLRSDPFRARSPPRFYDYRDPRSRSMGRRYDDREFSRDGPTLYPPPDRYDPYAPPREPAYGPSPYPPAYPPELPAPYLPPPQQTLPPVSGYPPAQPPAHMPPPTYLPSPAPAPAPQPYSLAPTLPPYQSPATPYAPPPYQHPASLTPAPSLAYQNPTTSAYSPDLTRHPPASLQPAAAPAATYTAPPAVSAAASPSPTSTNLPRPRLMPPGTAKLMPPGARASTPSTADEPLRQAAHLPPLLERMRSPAHAQSTMPTVASSSYPTRQAPQASPYQESSPYQPPPSAASPTYYPSYDPPPMPAPAPSPYPYNPVSTVASPVAAPYHPYASAPAPYSYAGPPQDTGNYAPYTASPPNPHVPHAQASGRPSRFDIAPGREADRYTEDRRDRGRDTPVRDFRERSRGYGAGDRGPDRLGAGGRPGIEYGGGRVREERGREKEERPYDFLFAQARR